MRTELLYIGYDETTEEDIAVLSVFMTENGRLKMVKGFVGEKAEKLYKILTEQKEVEK